MENDVFGTQEAAIIRNQLNAWSEEHLGSAIAQVRFVVAQLTYVTGVVLADGRHVVVRAHLTPTYERLLAVFETQRRLADVGFPCPRPLVPPVPLGRGVATAEELCDAGHMPDASVPEVRELMAHTFALLLRLMRGLAIPAVFHQEPPPWIDYHASALWATPHLPGLLFRQGTKEALWIDGIASTAKEQLLQMPAEDVILGHSDYCAHNVLVASRKIVTIFDWDSLAAEREEVLVGLAAATFPAHGGRHPDRPLASSPQQRWAFVRAVEGARGTAFTQEQRRHILAASTWVTAYNARVMDAFGLGHRVPGTAAFALGELADELATA